MISKLNLCDAESLIQVRCLSGVELACISDFFIQRGQ